MDKFLIRGNGGVNGAIHAPPGAADLVNDGGGNLATARSKSKIEKISASIAVIKPALMAHKPKPLAARAERWTELEAEFG